MSIWGLGLTTVLTLAVVAGVIFAVFRSELRREQHRQARRRHHHDSALGKDKSLNDSAVTATLGCHGGGSGGDVGSGD
jgi:hypothetical protein